MKKFVTLLMTGLLAVMCYASTVYAEGTPDVYYADERSTATTYTVSVMTNGKATDGVTEIIYDTDALVCAESDVVVSGDVALYSVNIVNGSIKVSYISETPVEAGTIFTVSFVVTDEYVNQEVSATVISVAHDADGNSLTTGEQVKPEPTEAPGATAEPEPTEAPGATAEPEPTETPGATAEPGATEAPGATAKPEPTGVPGATAKPETTEVPGATAKPEPTKKPATTATLGNDGNTGAQSSTENQNDTGNQDSAGEQGTAGNQETAGEQNTDGNQTATEGTDASESGKDTEAEVEVSEEQVEQVVQDEQAEEATGIPVWVIVLGLAVVCVVAAGVVFVLKKENVGGDTE